MISIACGYFNSIIREGTTSMGVVFLKYTEQRTVDFCSLRLGLITTIGYSYARGKQRFTVFCSRYKKVAPFHVVPSRMTQLIVYICCACVLLKAYPDGGSNSTIVHTHPCVVFDGVKICAKLAFFALMTAGFSINTAVRSLINQKQPIVPSLVCAINSHSYILRCTS